MRESMTLIEQVNSFKKTNHQNLVFDRIFSKKNIDVYSSGQLMSNTKQTKHYGIDKFILPPLDKNYNRYRRKPKRPSYRTSLYHSYSTNPTSIDLSSLTARGTKPELLTTIRDDDTAMNLQRHYAPPPSPSDYQLQQVLSEFNRTKLSTLRSPTVTNGYIPYRLPVLNQSIRRRYTQLNIPPKDSRSAVSNYLHTYY